MPDIQVPRSQARMIAECFIAAPENSNEEHYLERALSEACERERVSVDDAVHHATLKLAGFLPEAATSAEGGAE